MHVAYNETVILHDTDRLEPGSYVIPFTYLLPIEAAASSSFGSFDINNRVRHFAMARLLETPPPAPQDATHQDEEKKKDNQANENETKILRLLQLPDTSLHAPHVVALWCEELVRHPPSFE